MKKVKFTILEDFLQERTKRELVLLAFLVLVVSAYLSFFIIYPKVRQSYEKTLNNYQSLNARVQELQGKLEFGEELDYAKLKTNLQEIKEKIKDQDEQIQTYKNGYSSLNVLLFELNNRKLSQIAFSFEGRKIVLSGDLAFEELFSFIEEIDRDFNFTQIHSLSVYPSASVLTFYMTLLDLKEEK
ncbi:hypothetical protein B6S12_04820 [Helicobacter valdiviensis]|uniref:Uncharacterized protein n=1 Tax=Helicobacter valdiviensis TaxID=1458358 RepID=A0A2W6MUQ6_9HELI|nr:hypothetical protein [Helicobacter valdiviensis]PZT48254.1 hypothetical protein B6S12_04820 [Helicobacter valdiviensis]